MSNIKLQGDVSGTGSLTIAAPNTDVDRVLTLPDETGTLLTSGGASMSDISDYEEGTFTPICNGVTATTSGRYVKIGNRVFVDLRFAFTSTGTVAAASGLPFANQNIETNVEGMGVGREGSRTGSTWTCATAGATDLAMYQYDNSRSVQAGDVINFTISYETA